MEAARDEGWQRRGARGARVAARWPPSFRAKRARQRMAKAGQRNAAGCARVALEHRGGDRRSRQSRANAEGSGTRRCWKFGRWAPHRALIGASRAPGELLHRAEVVAMRSRRGARRRVWGTIFGHCYASAALQTRRGGCLLAAPFALGRRAAWTRRTGAGSYDEDGFNGAVIGIKCRDERGPLNYTDGRCLWPRCSLAGSDTRLAPKRPEFECRWRNILKNLPCW